MSSVEDRLSKLREDRIAREKARIEKLRELNLKKYNKNEPQQKHSVSNIPVTNKPVKSDNYSKNKISNIASTKNSVSNTVKNNFHVNGTTKRPITVPPLVTKKPVPLKDATAIQKPKSTSSIIKKDNPVNKEVKPLNLKRPDVIPKIAERKPSVTIDKNLKKDIKNDPKLRKSFAPVSKCSAQIKPSTNISSRKSMLPTKTQIVDNTNTTKESVFDRLYKPKPVVKKATDEVLKLQTDTNYLKKVIKDSGLILNKRHTVFDVKTKADHPVRRSISAVHFKRISKNEINNCIHKWSSIGEKLDKVHLKEINEDESVKQDKVISAIKSERKKVKFQTPVPFNFNTPRPEELQARLKSWLQKRGKSLDSFHHLQCFGIHHLPLKELKPIVDPPKFELYDDEDKENIALEHDSDNDSYTENINDLDEDPIDKGRWRRASYVSDCNDFNETCDSTITCSDTVPQIDEVLLGALNDLTELLKEGFDWEQCARWLRAIRDRFPNAPETAPYWECRAALEERRGDLPASVQCWEEAIAKGTERSVVEANLDQLLDKFMQLKISPDSGKRKQVDPKMVDVKNVFKSTIIRFAVQQAKLRQSGQFEPPKYTVTPVRRSGRLSARWSGRVPLRVCASVRQAKELGPVTFVPNETLCGSP